MNLKFCGLTREIDFRRAETLGADCAGFIFSHASPRYVSPSSVGKWTPSHRGGRRIRKIGVFVNASAAEIRLIVRQAGLDAVQLHGDENRIFGESLGCPWWKALRLRSLADLPLLEAFAGAESLLLDSFVEGLPGGTGRRLDPALAKAAIHCARRQNLSVWLAGGLCPENLAEAIALDPFGLDVNSGVEISPGIKDHAQMGEVALLLNKVSAV